MRNLLLLSSIILMIQACTYGNVNDSNTGSGIDTATVRVISGNCGGAGCTNPVTEQTSSSGLYIFDAYGDVNGAANVKLISPAAGQEAMTLLIYKSGYISRVVYHKPKYSTVTNNGKDYLVSAVNNVYLCPIGSPDSDGDSICDAAETRYGTDPNKSDTDGDSLSDAAELFGSKGVDLRYFGANPKHKDLFIEADYYPGLKPDQAALDQVVAAFADAPVNNPDGTTGINLHIDLNQQIAAADADSDLNPVWTDFDVIKAKYFNSRRDKLFHYALFANQYNGGGSSGISRGIPAHDFIVSLGTWSTPGGTTIQQAGTLMHEFGHNLGLRHGGNENNNNKINYLSIMSYTYQVRGLRIDGVDGNVDYSRLRIQKVDLSNLNEFTAFAPYGATTEADLSHYGVRWGSSWLTGNASANLDFDKDGVIEASVNIGSGIHNASPHDWSNLVYNGGGTIGDSLLGIDALLASSSYTLTPADLVESCMTEDDIK